MSIDLLLIVIIFLLLCAIDFVPSIATTCPLIRSISFKKETNNLNTFFNALGLSFLKSAIV